jgi:hypothetical protein
MGRDYRKESRRNYQSLDDCGFNREQLITGAILRAADALERIAPAAELAARRFADLVEEAAREKRMRQFYERALTTERKRTAALRGHLKKAKAEAKAAKAAKYARLIND